MMDNAAWIYLLAIFYALQLSVQVTGLPSKNLHHLMTKREIEHYFGVDDHDKVPEYDITHPYQSNEQGDLLSFSMQSHTRNKRDVEPPESAFYKMDAFGSTLHLKLLFRLCSFLSLSCQEPRDYHFVSTLINILILMCLSRVRHMLEGPLLLVLAMRQYQVRWPQK
ncbi:uncharacterized protein LOC122961546 [Acropora millepora]|uniref:uncharacterized protein LOC122961546 n=1 Tax=Acropora millepora TaxID=45264 RepID=UPI001CF31F39|nr:uncharacterized protein LOC122961546 [Acropora millepora]